MYESIVFVVRVRCRRKESSRSLSQLLMSFLLVLRPHFKSQHFRSFISQCQNGSVRWTYRLRWLRNYLMYRVKFLVNGSQDLTGEPYEPFDCHLWRLLPSIVLRAEISDQSCNAAIEHLQWLTSMAATTVQLSRCLATSLTVDFSNHQSTIIYEQFTLLI